MQNMYKQALKLCCRVYVGSHIGRVEDSLECGLDFVISTSLMPPECSQPSGAISVHAW